MERFAIELDDPTRDDVRALLEQHLDFARGTTPPEDVHALDLDGLLDPAITFFSLRVDGELLGVGAIKQLDPEHAELKSMHTASSARRRGVGRAIVDHLLSVAASRGVRRVSLETGSGEAFAPARSLYAGAGFVPCGPFADYRPSPNSAFMTRALAGFEVEHNGPRGCPVLHGFRPLEADQLDDPGALLSIARREAPVFFAPEFDMYVVTRHEDVRRVFADPDTFASIGLTEHEVPEQARDVLPDGFFPKLPGMRAWRDPEQHLRMRRLAQTAFTKKAALRNVTRMTELFDALIDEFASDGRIDLVPAYARRVPMQVVIAILGIDPSLESKLHAWVADFMQLMGKPKLDEPTLVELAHRQAEFYAWAAELTAERRRSPLGEGDLISDLIAASDEEGVRKLSDDEIIAIVLIAIIGGGDTSVILIGQLLRRALENDGALWRRFAADPDLIDRAIEEELRHSFIGRIISRRTTREVELGDVTIPQGALVGLHVWSSGRDDDVFANAERFDPDRPDADKHLGFGHGVRFCMGAPLARVETRVAIERLLERLPNLRLVPGHKLQRRASIALPSLEDGLVVEWEVPSAVSAAEVAGTEASTTIGEAERG